MENLKLCEIITSGDYGSMTDLTLQIFRRR